MKEDNNISNSDKSLDTSDILKKENLETEEEKKMGDMLAIISLILCYGTSFIISYLSLILPKSFNNFITSISAIMPLSGIVTMIVGRVKYSKNKFLKIAMWIIIGTAVFAIIASIIWITIFMIACNGTINFCSGFDTSGCD